jgi:hypothetical protein
MAEYKKAARTHTPLNGISRAGAVFEERESIVDESPQITDERKARWQTWHAGRLRCVRFPA